MSDGELAAKVTHRIDISVYVLADSDEHAHQIGESSLSHLLHSGIEGIISVVPRVNEE